jgi:hypothetical protein
MKKPTYTLSIPQPCHERWDAMTPSEKGRFCASCQTQVVDFTGLSDREVIQLIERSSGKVCGRLHPQQLDRPMVFEPWVQRASVRFSGFFAGLMMLSSAQPSNVQASGGQAEVVSVFSEGTTASGDSCLIVENEQNQDSLKNVIHGRVLDAETNLPVAFANVFAQDTSSGTSSGFDGEYFLKVSTRDMKDVVTVIVSYVGFEHYEFSVSSDELMHGIARDIHLKRMDSNVDRIEEHYYKGLIDVDRRNFHK